MLAAGLAACGGNQFQTTTGASPDAGIDSGAPADAGGAFDAGDAPDSPGPPLDAGSFCAGRTELFCEDFDEYPDLAALLGAPTWPGFEHVNGSFQLDTSESPPPPSPPNALDVQGDDGAQVLIVKTFGPRAVPKRAALTFDLRINDPGTVGPLSAAGFAAIAVGDTLDAGYVAMAIASVGGAPVLTAVWSRSAGASGPDAGSFGVAASGNGTMGTFPAAGVWDGDYTLEMTFGVTAANPAGGPCLQVYRAVAPLLAQCLPLPPQFAAPSVFSIALGDEAGGGARTGSIDIEFDNVLFDAK
jgi:hypothetical protein